MKRLTLHRLASSLHRCQHLINPYRNRQINREKRSKTYVKAKTTMFFCFATEITEITNFFWKLPLEFIASSLLSVNIFFFKALRQWRQFREAMKQWNVKYGKKSKQWSDEAFNAGKESEAMKRLTLHRIASSLHRFIASSAQLCPFYIQLLICAINRLKAINWTCYCAIFFFSSPFLPPPLPFSLLIYLPKHIHTTTR